MRDKKNIVKVENNEDPSKEEILKGLKDSIIEIKLHKEGKIQLEPAKKYLNKCGSYFI